MPHSLDISVIIPTHNRLQALIDLLGDLNQQTLSPERFEVLIIDDGSTVDPRPSLSDLSVTYPLTLLRQANRGPARARNRAIEQCEGRLLLFLNDDVRVAPDLLWQHLAVHSVVIGPVGVLGGFQFPEAVRADSLSRILERNHLVISTESLIAGGYYSYRAFWTGNLSIARDLVKAVGAFDEGYVEPSHEDLDLGYRLGRTFDLKVLHHPAAKAEHHHQQTLSAYRRQRLMGGKNGFRMFNKYGDTEDFSEFYQLHGLEEKRFSLGVVRAVQRQLKGQLPLIAEMVEILARVCNGGDLPPAPAGWPSSLLSDLMWNDGREAYIGAACRILGEHDQLSAFFAAAECSLSVIPEQSGTRQMVIANEMRL